MAAQESPRSHRTNPAPQSLIQSPSHIQGCCNSPSSLLHGLLTEFVPSILEREKPISPSLSLYQVRGSQSSSTMTIGLRSGRGSSYGALDSDPTADFRSVKSL